MKQLQRTVRGRSSLGLVAHCTVALFFAFGTLSSATADEAAPAPAFATRRLEIPSRNFGSPIPVVALVPTGHAPATGWPLVLLLHGLGGGANDWTVLGRADDTFGRLLASNTIRPAVIVMPGMGSNWYVDALEPNGIKAERALMEDVLPAVRQAFGTSSDAHETAIIGNSMGGYGALRFAIKYPTTFGAVAALSPAIWQNVPPDELDLPPDRINLIIESTYFHRATDNSITEGIVLPNPGPHFSKVFGEPFQPRRFNELNPFTLLQKRLSDGADLPRMFLSVGDHDSHLLWRGAISLFETMRAHRREIAFRVTDGDHTWDVWRDALPDALKFALARK